MGRYLAHCSTRNICCKASSETYLAEKRNKWGQSAVGVDEERVLPERHREVISLLHFPLEIDVFLLIKYPVRDFEDTASSEA